MANVQIEPFDSDPKITHIHGGPQGGPPGGDQLEKRVEILENDMKELKADMKALRLDVAEVKGMLKTMPTTIQLIGFAVAVFVASGLVKLFGS
ncbi:MAG: hypothetical protein INR68_19240 [Methylobacterium mesophilicum]|nr:hypothetical protein [Methylobacterium mesophilicum]